MQLCIIVFIFKFHYMNGGSWILLIFYTLFVMTGFYAYFIDWTQYHCTFKTSLRTTLSDNVKKSAKVLYRIKHGYLDDLSCFTAKVMRTVEGLASWPPTVNAGGGHSVQLYPFIILLLTNPEPPKPWTL